MRLGFFVARAVAAAIAWALLTVVLAAALGLLMWHIARTATP